MIKAHPHWYFWRERGVWPLTPEVYWLVFLFIIKLLRFIVGTSRYPHQHNSIKGAGGGGGGRGKERLVAVQRPTQAGRGWGGGGEGESVSNCVLRPVNHYGYIRARRNRARETEGRARETEGRERETGRCPKTQPSLACPVLTGEWQETCKMSCLTSLVQTTATALRLRVLWPDSKTKRVRSSTFSTLTTKQGHEHPDRHLHLVTYRQGCRQLGPDLKPTPAQLPQNLPMPHAHRTEPAMRLINIKRYIIHLHTLRLIQGM